MFLAQFLSLTFPVGPPREKSTQTKVCMNWKLLCVGVNVLISFSQCFDWQSLDTGLQPPTATSRGSRCRKKMDGWIFIRLAYLLLRILTLKRKHPTTHKVFKESYYWQLYFITLFPRRAQHSFSAAQTRNCCISASVPQVSTCTTTSQRCCSVSMSGSGRCSSSCDRDQQLLLI